MEYCTDSASSSWECGRAIGMGIVCFIGMVACWAALVQVVKAHYRRRMFGLNVAMITLSLLQSNLDVIELLGKREARIQLMSITLRCLQTNIACSAYASFILENRHASASAFWLFVAPFSALALAVTLILFVFSCLEDEVRCEHPMWLIMSSLQLLISIIFSFVGLFASKEVSANLAVSALSSELIKKRRDLWLLMATFLIASLAQLVADSWRQALFQDGNSCRFHETHIEEVLKTLLFFLSFVLPVWGVLLVFYWRQRRVMELEGSEAVVLPAMQLLQWDERDIRGGEDEGLEMENRAMEYSDEDDEDDENVIAALALA